MIERFWYSWGDVLLPALLGGLVVVLVLGAAEWLVRAPRK